MILKNKQTFFKFSRLLSADVIKGSADDHKARVTKARQHVLGPSWGVRPERVCEINDVFRKKQALIE